MELKALGSFISVEWASKSEKNNSIVRGECLRRNPKVPALHLLFRNYKDTRTGFFAVVNVRFWTLQTLKSEFGTLKFKKRVFCANWFLVSTMRFR